jgi:hypothetical protein
MKRKDNSTLAEKDTHLRELFHRHSNDLRFTVSSAIEKVMYNKPYVSRYIRGYYIYFHLIQVFLSIIKLLSLKKTKKTFISSF